MSRNLALDALRAFAILSVFTAHTVNSYGSPSYLAPLQFGGSGVDLFFVLSGWLIGTQLYKEHDAFGSIELKRFWLRRWMRTVPAYYAVLIVTQAQQVITKDEFEFSWQYYVFLQNYIGDLPIFYVSWSLSVEEQFYLFIAPFVLLSLKFDKRVQVALLLLILLLPSLFRSLELYSSYTQTHVRVDCCVIGVLLAYLKQNHKFYWTKLSSFAKPLLLVSVLFYCFIYLKRYNPEWGIDDPSFLLLALCFGSWVIAADNIQLKPEALCSKLIYHVSTRSYAMYLLHVDALALVSKFFNNTPFIIYYGLTLFVTMVASEVLFRLVEKPFMDARNWFDASKSRKQVVQSYNG